MARHFVATGRFLLVRKERLGRDTSPRDIGRADSVYHSNQSPSLEYGHLPSAVHSYSVSRRPGIPISLHSHHPSPPPATPSFVHLSWVIRIYDGLAFGPSAFFLLMIALSTTSWDFQHALLGSFEQLRTLACFNLHLPAIKAMVSSSTTDWLPASTSLYILPATLSSNSKLYPGLAYARSRGHIPCH